VVVVWAPADKATPTTNAPASARLTFISFPPGSSGCFQEHVDSNGGSGLGPPPLAWSWLRRRQRGGGALQSKIVFQAAPGAFATLNRIAKRGIPEA
jgi:hypothetical protein